MGKSLTGRTPAMILHKVLSCVSPIPVHVSCTVLVGKWVDPIKGCMQ